MESELVIEEAESRGSRAIEVDLLLSMAHIQFARSSWSEASFPRSRTWELESTLGRRHLNSTPKDEISFQRQTRAPLPFAGWILLMCSHTARFPLERACAAKYTLCIALSQFNAPLNGGSRFPMAKSTRNKRCRHHLSRVALRIYLPLDFILYPRRAEDEGLKGVV